MKLHITGGVALLALVGSAVIAGGGRDARAALLLAVDVNDRTPTDGSTTDSGTQAGFSPYLLGDTGGTAAVTSTLGVTREVGDGFSLNFATILSYPVGGGTGSVQDLDRNFSFPAGLTNAELYDDFVYNASNTGGLRVTISGGNGDNALQPDTQYLISIYAYDHGSGGVRRTATYVDQNNSDAVVLSTSFIGGAVPQTNDANKFTGLAMTDASGVISLRGINTTAITPATGLPSNFGLFISGLEVNSVPEPTAATALVGLGGLILARRRRR